MESEQPATGNVDAWAAAEFSDSGVVVFSLRCRCQRLVTVVDLVGPSVIEGGVAPAAVVEALDISDDIAPGLGLGGVYGAVDPLVLQR